MLLSSLKIYLCLFFNLNIIFFNQSTLTSKEQIKKTYFYIDECGDPCFYGSKKKLLVGTVGFQPLLIIGMISGSNRKFLRKKVLEFQKSILDDPMYNTIPSLNKEKQWYLHAKDDHPEIRAKFFELLRGIKGFKAYVIIGRKNLEIFTKKHNSNETEFYFDLLMHLLKDRMHVENETYQIFLAQRDKNTMKKFVEAVERALERDNKRRKKPIKVNYKCDIVPGANCPEMSIVDYLLWALQRYIQKGEGRFFKALSNKYALIIDLYDKKSYKKNGGHGNYYTVSNPFDLEKASAFET